MRWTGDAADGSDGGGNDADVDSDTLAANGAGTVERLRAAVAARRGTVVYECRAVKEAVEGSDDNTITRDRWSIVRHFLHTFLAEPLVGAFAGLDRPAIKDLEMQLILAPGAGDWLSAAGAIESVAVAWPFLRLVGTDDDADPQLFRATGELLLFAEGVDTL